jgi:hypothetical protein
MGRERDERPDSGSEGPDAERRVVRDSSDPSSFLPIITPYTGFDHLDPDLDSSQYELRIGWKGKIID